MNEQPIFKAVGVAKHFGNIVALRNVNFEIYPGEVVGLVGDNGAGKSTFIKILSGVHKRDGGQLFLDGEEVFFESPREAIDAGIETVYQDLSLAPELGVYQNIYLGREIHKKGLLGRLGFMDRKQMKRTVADDLKRLKININSVEQQVGTMSGGQRQAVAIARSIAWGSKVVLMDEPTAALGVEEAEKTLELVGEIKAKGLAVIFISHTLPHVMSAADRIVVLTLGETVANLRAEDTSLNEVVEYITGSKTLKMKR